MSPVKKFFIQFSHFLTGGALSLLLGLITFPILTRVMSTEQYGIMGLVTTTMSLTVAFSKAGLSNGIIRFYQKFRDNEAQRTVFASTVFIRGLILSIITTGLYLSLFPFLSRYLGINEKFVFCFMIMAAYLFIRPVNIIILNMLRVNDKTIFMNLLGLAGKIISITLSLTLFIYIIHDLYGYFVGIIISEFIVSIFLFYWFFSNYKIKYNKVSKDLTACLIKFGAPLLFTELSYLLLSYADRYMLVAWHGESALGIYSVGYNLAMYISGLLTFSLAYSVIPVYVEVFEKYGRERTEEFLNKCMHYLIIAVLPICFGYYAIANDLFIFLASEKYILAATFSPIILVGTFIMGMNDVFNAGLYLKKKSVLILIIMLAAVAVNIILNLILLPKFGIMGAALATLVACLLSSVLTISLSFKYIAVRVRIWHIAYYLFLSILMYCIVLQVNPGGHFANLLTKIIVGGCVIVLGVTFKEKEIVSFLKKSLIKHS